MAQGWPPSASSTGDAGEEFSSHAAIGAAAARCRRIRNHRHTMRRRLGDPRILRHLAQEDPAAVVQADDVDDLCCRLTTVVNHREQNAAAVSYTHLRAHE